MQLSAAKSPVWSPYLPSMHGVGSDDPSPHQWPSVQMVQPKSSSKPKMPLKLPAGHGVVLTAPTTQ